MKWQLQARTQQLTQKSTASQRSVYTLLNGSGRHVRTEHSRTYGLHTQAGAGPSKSAKKKAKKKAVAAARKADTIQTNGSEGLEEASTNRDAKGHAESNGVQHAETNGSAGKKEKSNGMLTATASTYL